MRFREWFFECQIAEARALLPPGVLQQWEAGFRQGLDGLIARTSDPVLRSKFAAMRDCPIRDMAGRCRTFTDYVVGTMLKHGVHRKADIEDALAYAYETMMSPRKVTGEPKTTVFDLDPRRPVGRNELEARFKTSVGNAVRNIASGKIRRLSTVEQRPQGTLSLVPGRSRGFSPGTIGSDQLPARRDASGDLAADITDLLRRREAASGNLPLVSLFQSMLAGESDRERRAKFGDRVAQLGRQVIVSTIRDYATATDNYQLLNLLQKLSAADNQQPPAAPAPKPSFSPDEQVRTAFGDGPMVNIKRPCPATETQNAPGKKSASAKQDQFPSHGLLPQMGSAASSCSGNWRRCSLRAS